MADEPWRSLVNALDMGAAEVGDSMVAPAAFALDDDETTGIVVGRGVQIGKRPSLDGPVVGRASLERVRVEAAHQFEVSVFDEAEAPESPAAWALITTAEGVRGYVYGRYLYTVDRDRFVFERVGGQWMLVSWAGGMG